ncbi:MAG: hypothetical protein WCS70_12585 [Verrucomicrobiota bacterium]
MKKLRIYLDTSVFGGCFDPEFATVSCRLFDEIRASRFEVVISDTLVAELQPAPPRVRNLLVSLKPQHVEFVELSPEAEQLRDAYIAAGVVGRASREDAEHIAIASVAEVDMVVSWNFKHIVHFEKIAGFNAVNLLHGYKPLQVFSPNAVVTP